MAEKSAGDKLVDDIKDSLTLKGARDAVSHVVDHAKQYLGFAPDKPAPQPVPKSDPWHDDMTKRANDSFKPQPQATPQPTPQPTPKKPPKTLPKYKDGTDFVQKTGPAILHKGEAVLTKKEADKHRESKASWTGNVKNELGGQDAKPPKTVHEIRTRRGKSGGYIHEHHHQHPEHHPMEEHVSTDQETMLKHLMTHMGASSPEQAAEPSGISD